MIIGVGIDIVELDRIENMVNKQLRFIDKILTENEKKVYQKLSAKRKIEYVGGRFAAKEAFVKAIGTGISAQYGWLDIEVLNEENGRPIMYATTDYNIHLSISHSDSYAVAQVILERLSS